MFDRQTEEARCRLKRYRANVNRINNLLKMPVRINGPSKNVTVKIDDNPGGFIPKSHPDAMSDLQRMVEINSTIASYVLEVNEIGKRIKRFKQGRKPGTDNARRG